jgi:hypothetical protein
MVSTLFGQSPFASGSTAVGRAFGCKIYGLRAIKAKHCIKTIYIFVTNAESRDEYKNWDYSGDGEENYSSK